MTINRAGAPQTRRALKPLETRVTCRELADFIHDYLEGTLAAGVGVRFERHLTRCPACVAYLSAYRVTIALGRAAFEDEDRSVALAGVPDSLVRGILAAVRGEHASS